MKCKGQYIIL